MKRQPTTSKEQLEKDIKILRDNAESVRELLIRKNAEDLIPVLLSDLDEIYPVRELVGSPNGARIRKRK